MVKLAYIYELLYVFRLFKEYIYQEEDGLAFIEQLQGFCDCNENLENLRKSFHIVLQVSFEFI